MSYRPRNHLMPTTPAWQRVCGAVCWCVAIVGSVMCALWGLMALRWEAPTEHNMADAFALVWGFAWVILLGYAMLQKRILPIMAGGLALMLAILLWWATISPRNDRDWAPEVAQLLQIHIPPGQANRVQLRHVRNFTWRSEEDFTPHWETRDYDLSQLRSVDMALGYWMGPAIAHTLVSFGFANGEHLVFSVEIRKERGEGFDALAGFFKQYEMALVAADERDILRLRTQARGEQVYMYRVNMAPKDMQALFMAYAHQAELLAHAPSFYHTLTANCTTIVWQLARRIGQQLPLDWRLLASGYLPEYLRDIHGLHSLQPLSVLRTKGHIDARANSWQPTADMSDAEASIDFSRHIRAGMD